MRELLSDINLNWKTRELKNLNTDKIHIDKGYNWLHVICFNQKYLVNYIIILNESGQNYQWIHTHDYNKARWGECNDMALH